MEKKNRVKTIEYGFVAPQVMGTDEYILGGGNVPEVVLNESGQWDEYLPKYEPQFGEGWDSFGCTVWGTLNAIEAYIKFQTGKEYNYSERFNYILAGIRPPGSDPHKVAEIIRKKGVIDDEFLPMTKTYGSFIQPDPMTTAFLKLGEEWGFSFQHEWVVPIQKDLMQALKYSPVGISVTAWNEENGVFVDGGLPNNHWCLLYGWSDKGWKVFDSYDHTYKVVSFDHNIQFAKRFYITLKDLRAEKLSIIAKMLQAIGIALGLIQKNVEELPKVEDVKQPEPKYKWNSPLEARKSVVKVCGEEGLDKAETDLICAVIDCESGFRIDAKNENKDKNGKVLSTDWGIIQANDYWYIGKDKPIASVDEALNDPEKCVRVMIKVFKQRGLSDWICYRHGYYKKHLNK